MAEAVEGRELALMCVGRDDDVREVMEAALPALNDGASSAATMMWPRAIIC